MNKDNKQHILTRTSFKMFIARFLKMQGKFNLDIHDVLSDFIMIKEADEKNNEEYCSINIFDILLERINEKYKIEYNTLPFKIIVSRYKNLKIKEFKKNIITNKDYLSTLCRYGYKIDLLDKVEEDIYENYIYHEYGLVSFSLLSIIRKFNEHVKNNGIANCYCDLSMIERRCFNNCTYYE